MVKENPAYLGGFTFRGAKAVKVGRVMGERGAVGEERLSVAEWAELSQGLVLLLGGLLWERDVTPQDRERRQTKGGKEQEGGAVSRGATKICHVLLLKAVGKCWLGSHENCSYG